MTNQQVIIDSKKYKLYVGTVNNTANELAFLIHESASTPQLWNNELFLRTLHAQWQKIMGHTSYPASSMLEPIIVTTCLGDIFEYKPDFSKHINGVEVFKRGEAFTID